MILAIKLGLFCELEVLFNHFWVILFCRGVVGFCVFVGLAIKGDVFFVFLC